MAAGPPWTKGTRIRDGAALNRAPTPICVNRRRDPQTGPAATASRKWAPLVLQKDRIAPPAGADHPETRRRPNRKQMPIARQGIERPTIFPAKDSKGPESDKQDKPGCPCVRERSRMDIRREGVGPRDGPRNGSIPSPGRCLCASWAEDADLAAPAVFVARPIPAITAVAAISPGAAAYVRTRRFSRSGRPCRP
jgi:hypothetical protein